MSNFWTWWTSPAQPNPQTSQHPTPIRYWDYNIVSWIYGQLKNAGMSDNAVSGLLGNIHWESGICPYKCEGISIVERSLNYTVDNIVGATRAQFISTTDPAGRYPGGTGYSLAQWSYSRKGDYWDYNGHNDWNLVGTEYQYIRDTGFLIQDLQTWSMTTSINPLLWDSQGRTVWQWLTDPNVSLYDALQAVLMIYERPWSSAPSQADWTREWYEQRLAPANDILYNFAGVTPPPTPPIPPIPPTPTPVNGLPIWMYFKIKEKGGTL